MTLSQPSRPSPLVERARNILLRPGAEWDVIDAEPATVQGLITGYAVPLAAIGPVCSAIGLIIFGVGVPGIAMFHPSPVGVIVSCLVSYLLALLGVFLLGLIIDALAPTFGGVKNQVQAMKVAVYSSTASWLAGVFGIVPMLGILAIVGLYSLFLLYKGLPKLMKTSEDKAMGYTALTVVCAIVMFIVIGLVTAPLRMLGGVVPGAGLATAAGTAGVVKVGGATMDLAALQAASKQMEAQANAMQAQANGAAVAGATAAAVAQPEALKALLPMAVNGFTRGEISAESGGVGGLNTSHAEASYARGDAHMKLEVTDSGGMAGLAGLAGAMGVNTSKETATGYEKVSTVNGRMTTEEYDRSSRHGKFGVMAGRMLINAEGDGVSMDDLKAAVSAVDPNRAAALAKG